MRVSTINFHIKRHVKDIVTKISTAKSGNKKKINKATFALAPQQKRHSIVSSGIGRRRSQAIEAKSANRNVHI